MSIEDVSTVAAQLGFRGKDGLVMEPKAILQEEEDVIILEEENEAGESANIAEQGTSGTGLVESTVNDLDSTVDDLEISEETDMAAGGGTNGNDSNINEEVAVVTELAEKEAVSTIEANHDGISFLERGDFQGGSQGIDEEVPSSLVEFLSKKLIPPWLASMVDTASSSANSATFSITLPSLPLVPPPTATSVSSEISRSSTVLSKLEL